jgi:hypothetical protein
MHEKASEIDGKWPKKGSKSRENGTKTTTFERLRGDFHFLPRSGWITPGEVAERHPSGAKARHFFVAFAARLKSCPDTL